MATPTARWARATREKRGLRALKPEAAHGWGMATRKKLGLGAVRTAPTAQERTARRTSARATQATRTAARQQRATRRATLKARGVRRAQTARPSGLAGGARASKTNLRGGAFQKGSTLRSRPQVGTLGRRRAVRRGRVRRR